MDAKLLIKTPSNITFEQAATLGVGSLVCTNAVGILLKLNYCRQLVSEYLTASTSKCPMQSLLRPPLTSGFLYLAGLPVLASMLFRYVKDEQLYLIIDRD